MSVSDNLRDYIAGRIPEYDFRLGKFKDLDYLIYLYPSVCELVEQEIFALTDISSLSEQAKIIVYIVESASQRNNLCQHMESKDKTSYLIISLKYSDYFNRRYMKRGIEAKISLTTARILALPVIENVNHACVLCNIMCYTEDIDALLEDRPVANIPLKQFLVFVYVYIKYTRNPQIMRGDIVYYPRALHDSVFQSVTYSSFWARAYLDLYNHIDQYVNP